MRKLFVTILGKPEPCKRVTRHCLWKAKPYAAWKKSAAWAIAAEASGDTIETPAKILALVYGVHNRADGDNYFKGVADSCVLAGIIPNDNTGNVPDIHIKYAIDKKNPRVEITIETIGER